MVDRPTERDSGQRDQYTRMSEAERETEGGGIRHARGWRTGPGSGEQSERSHPIAGRAVSKRDREDEHELGPPVGQLPMPARVNG